MEKVITLEEFNELLEEYNNVVKSFYELKSSVSSSLSDLEDKMCSFSYLMGSTKLNKFVNNKNKKCCIADSNIEFDEATCEYSWERTLPNGTSKSRYYGKFVKDVLELFSPIVIRISTNMLPIISFSDLFVPAGKTPLKGNFVYGDVSGVPIILDHNLENTVEIEDANGETCHIKIYTNGN